MTVRGIILRDKKMVYWYLPKTCCTALKTYFAKELGLTIPYKNGDEMDIHGQEIGFEFTEKVIPEYFNFAFVRNPFDRVVSLYSQKIKNTVDRKVFPDSTVFYQGMPFSEFVDAIINIKEKERHYIPQSEMILDGVHVYKMEMNIFLKFIKPLNVSEKIYDVWDHKTRNKIIEFYKNDFIKFNYSYE